MNSIELQQLQSPMADMGNIALTYGLLISTCFATGMAAGRMFTTHLPDGSIPTKPEKFLAALSPAAGVLVAFVAYGIAYGSLSLLGYTPGELYKSLEPSLVSSTVIGVGSLGAGVFSTLNRELPDHAHLNSDS